MNIINKYGNDGVNQCGELHIGNTPRSIMTKGNSISFGTQYGNFIRGNKDKLMITYRREPSHDYTMYGACGVLFEGEIHFFGGDNQYWQYGGESFTDLLNRQHFVIETKRSGQLVKMTKKEDFKIRLFRPSCSSFEITSKHFVVILCFDIYHRKSCYSFDGKLNDIGNSNYEHHFGGLAIYKRNLLTVGGTSNQKTEILEVDENKNFSWSLIEQDFKFTQGKYITGHSLVTVESSYINEEYVLIIGGKNSHSELLRNVFKFNGTWFPFGKLNKPRKYHNSIYWNGAVYVIGGIYGEGYDWDDTKTKMEIWNIKDSSDQFKTTENWPELFGWETPHLFIVPDSFFPDH